MVHLNISMYEILQTKIRLCELSEAGVHVCRNDGWNASRAHVRANR